MTSILVDDFQDRVNFRFADFPEKLHAAKYAVRVVSTDLIAAPPDFAPGSIDIITSFDSLEHWHHSPKALLARAVTWLKPDGVLILGVPNCVNLRKRLSIPFGRGKWSQMSEWYDAKHFRGHVREPDVDDLRYIARDLQLRNIEIFGRNWLGHLSRNAMVRVLTTLVDYPLRAMPSLCSDLYLVGRRT